MAYLVESFVEKNIKFRIIRIIKRLKNQNADALVDRTDQYFSRTEINLRAALGSNCTPTTCRRRFNAIFSKITKWREKNTNQDFHTAVAKP